MMDKLTEEDKRFKLNRRKIKGDKRR